MADRYVAGLTLTGTTPDEEARVRAALASLLEQRPPATIETKSLQEVGAWAVIIEVSGLRQFAQGFAKELGEGLGAGAAAGLKRLVNDMYDAFGARRSKGRVIIADDTRQGAMVGMDATLPDEAYEALPHAPLDPGAITEWKQHSWTIPG